MSTRDWLFCAEIELARSMCEQLYVVHVGDVWTDGQANESHPDQKSHDEHHRGVCGRGILVFDPPIGVAEVCADPSHAHPLSARDRDPFR